jgi:hypothetical protein
MSTNIYNYDGTLLTTIADGSISTNSASIKFPGRGYVNYGAPVNENMLWIMQNFAAGTSPSNPVNGQTWYDTTSKLLKVYDALTLSWVAVGGVIASATAPLSGSNAGAFWYSTTTNQLYVWSGSAWLLVGPLGASDGLDPLDPAVPSYSTIDSVRVSDGTNDHNIWRITIGSTLLGIFSLDAAFVPNPAISGFSTIVPGLNLNSTVSGIGIGGDTTLFKSTQNNIPNVDNTYSMGSASFRFANMWAVTFNGTATTALYADLAERYEADAVYEPGTVVSLGGAKEITASSVQADTNVFGVISTAPGYLMNSDAGNNDTHPPVALSGRVPCKVAGVVRKGERLMTSAIPGVAVAWSPACSDLAIIGRSLVDKETPDISTIEISVGKN